MCEVSFVYAEEFPDPAAHRTICSAPAKTRRDVLLCLTVMLLTSLLPDFVYFFFVIYIPAYS